MSLKTIPQTPTRQLQIAVCPTCKATVSFEQTRTIAPSGTTAWEPGLAAVLEERGWRLADGGRGWCCSARCQPAPAAPEAPREFVFECAEGCGAVARAYASTLEGCAGQLRTQGWTDRAQVPAPGGGKREVLTGWTCGGTCAGRMALRLDRDPQYRETCFEDGGSPKTARKLAERAAAQHEPPEPPQPAHVQCHYRGCEAHTDPTPDVDFARWMDAHAWRFERGNWYCSTRCIALESCEKPVTLPAKATGKLSDLSWNRLNDRSRKERGMRVFEQDGVTPTTDHVVELPPQPPASKPRAGRAAR
jgi:hypothetical protein